MLSSKKARSGKLYEVGDVVGVPLDRGGFGIVVVAARWEKKRRGVGIILCYGFDGVYEKVPSLEEVGRLRPDQAICVQLCGDRAIVDKRWSWLGQLPLFSEHRWPCPVTDSGKIATLLRVSDWAVAEISMEKYVPGPKRKLLRTQEPGLGMADYLECGLDEAIRDRKKPDYFPVSSVALEFWIQLYEVAEKKKLFKYK